MGGDVVEELPEGEGGDDEPLEALAVDDFEDGEWFDDDDDDDEWDEDDDDPDSESSYTAPRLGLRLGGGGGHAVLGAQRSGQVDDLSDLADIVDAVADDAIIAEEVPSPDLTPGIDDVVFAFNEDLRPAAISVATRLRAAGRSVDLVLEKKKAKWAFKHADRAGAQRMIMLAPREWEQGLVTVKDLATGDQSAIPLEELS